MFYGAGDATTVYDLTRASFCIIIRMKSRYVYERVNFSGAMSETARPAGRPVHCISL